MDDDKKRGKVKVITPTVHESSEIKDAEDTTDKSVPESDDSPGLAIKSEVSSVSFSSDDFKTKKPKHLVYSLVLILVIVIAIVWIISAIANRNSSKTAVIVDTWTGAGDGTNWSDATNWSGGVPKNGESLEFNLSLKPKSSFVFFNNNIAGDPTFSQLIIEGALPASSNTVNYSEPAIIGKVFSLTGGINDESRDTTFNITTALNLRGNQTISIVSGESSLVVGEPGQASTANTNVGNGTITFDANGTSTIFINDITGSATLAINDTNPYDGASVNYYGSSPAFNGKIDIESGILTASPSTLGNVPINISSGAALSLLESSASTSTTINNPITMSGKGLVAAAVGGYTKQNTGAIYLCLTGGSSYCQYPSTLNFAGQVTLLGNTQLGINPIEQAPSSSTINYSFSKVVKGNYNISAIPGSQASVSD